MLMFYADEVFVAFVVSSKAHAKILKVDTSKALEMEGVVGCIDSKDVPGANNYGQLAQDDALFTVDTVNLHKLSCLVTHSHTTNVIIIRDSNVKHF